MAQYFNEYFNRKVRIKTTDGKIIDGIVEDGLRILVYKGLFLSDIYKYSIKLSGRGWYDLGVNSIVLIDA